MRKARLLAIGTLTALTVLVPTSSATAGMPLSKDVGTSDYSCRAGIDGNRAYALCTGGGDLNRHHVNFRCRSIGGNVSEWLRGPTKHNGDYSYGQRCGEVMNGGVVEDNPTVSSY